MNYRQALTNDELRRYVPSAFAVEPYHAQSERYAFIPTISVIEEMRVSGFVPVQATQSRTRIADKQDFTKHMIRFRQLTGINQLAVVGEHVIELVLVNSHDGTSRYEFFGGVWRFTCANGAMVSDSVIAAVKIKHTGNVVQEALQATFSVFEQAPKVLDVIGKWQGIHLSQPEQLALAEASHSVRFPVDETTGKASTLVTPQNLLMTRRNDDRKDDLWTTFNRIQENTTKKTRYGRDYSTGRPIANRAIKSIDGDVKLQRALWTLAEKMAELKRGNDVPASIAGLREA